jgi:hypothetical protein
VDLLQKPLSFDIAILEILEIVFRGGANCSLLRAIWRSRWDSVESCCPGSRRSPGITPDRSSGIDNLAIRQDVARIPCRRTHMFSAFRIACMVSRPPIKPHYYVAYMSTLPALWANNREPEAVLGFAHEDGRMDYNLYF